MLNGVGKALSTRIKINGKYINDFINKNLRRFRPCTQLTASQFHFHTSREVAIYEAAHYLRPTKQILQNYIKNMLVPNHERYERT